MQCSFGGVILDLYKIFADATTAPAATSATSKSTEIINEATTLKTIWDIFLNWCVTTGLRVLISLIIMFISFKVINFISRKITRKLEKKNADVTLSKVLVNVFRISLKCFVLVMLVGYIGIETASVSAVLASVGVGISLAVQGTLSNFAGGVIIIIMRPFKIGDFITSNGQMGTVEDIKLFYTHVVAPDNKMIYIPNGQLANNVIVNNSVKETRRVELLFSVAYDTNTDLAKNLIKKVCNNYELVLPEPAPFAEISEFGESGIIIKVRAWCKNSDYWTVNYYLLDEIKQQFNEHHIVIPYNQLDVTIKNDK